MQGLYPEDRDTFRLIVGKAAAGDGTYEAEYRLLLPGGEVRWIGSHGRVELDGARKPILLRAVSHDITARKEAEMETQKLRREIAHAGRVSMMGQLASALAHEINQPLGAILRNAEAAELFMQNPSPDLDEIRAILADIRKDDQRADNVISRMRGLMKRRELDERPLDVNGFVAEVVSLVRSEAGRLHEPVTVHDSLPVVGVDALSSVRLEDRRSSLFNLENEWIFSAVGSVGTACWMILLMGTSSGSRPSSAFSTRRTGSGRLCRGFHSAWETRGHLSRSAFACRDLVSS